MQAPLAMQVARCNLMAIAIGYQKTALFTSLKLITKDCEHTAIHLMQKLKAQDWKWTKQLEQNRPDAVQSLF